MENGERKKGNRQALLLFPRVVVSLRETNSEILKRYALLLLLLSMGCSSNPIPPEKIESAQVKYDQAESLINAKDYGSALPILDQVIAGGLLGPDFAVSSLVMRATCRIEQGDLPGGLEDIESATLGVSDMSIIHGLRYKYWMKAGDPTKAQNELRLGQQVNPQFRLP